MNLIDIGIFIVGVGLISWLIFGKVRQMFHQVEMFKQMGGPEVGSYIPSKKEIKKLVGNVIQDTKRKKEKDDENEQNNMDKGMYG